MLGPILFLKHINDLQNNTSLSVLNFEDDTMLYKIFTKNTNLNDSKRFNKEIKKVLDYKKYNDSVRELKTQKILNVKILYLYELGLFMLKFNDNLLPANFNNYYKSVKNAHNYHTRSSETIVFLPRLNSKIGHESLSYQGIKLWIKLPLFLMSISYFGKFQDKLKSCL